MLGMDGIGLRVVVSLSVGWIGLAGYMGGWTGRFLVPFPLSFLFSFSLSFLCGTDGWTRGVDITGVASKLNRECHLQHDDVDIAAARCCYATDLKRRPFKKEKKETIMKDGRV
ncbi:hypothetical protein BKA80DRAFT_110333 [Phyllosticta citrichinensis]